MRHEGCGSAGPDKRDVCQHYVHKMFNTGGRTITRRAVGTEKHARKVKCTCVVIFGNHRISSSPTCGTKINKTAQNLQNHVGRTFSSWDGKLPAPPRSVPALGGPDPVRNGARAIENHFGGYAMRCACSSAARRLLVRPCWPMFGWVG